jgi:protein-disulfide isomerase
MTLAKPFRGPAAAFLSLALFGLAGCGPEKHDDLFGQRVRAYLLSHPEILQEMSDKLQARANTQAQADQEKVLAQGKAALARPAIRAALERDGRDFVANPNGKVTVTEFYDYRCPHCINMAATVVSMIQQYPNTRFVFKEMPIFGSTSDRAALAAIAIRKKGGDSLGAYATFMGTRGLDDATVDKVLRGQGIDPASIDNAEAQRQIADTKTLASTIGAAGTPYFVIGDTIIPGEGEAQLRSALAQAGAS